MEKFHNRHHINLFSQNEKTGESTTPCSTIVLKTGVTPLTEIPGNAIPRIPSNCAAKKAKPGS